MTPSPAAPCFGVAGVRVSIQLKAQHADTTERIAIETSTTTRQTCAAAIALAAALGTTSPALALNPEDAATLEQSVTVTPEAVFELRRDDGRVGVLNREQCRKAFIEKQPFTFRFVFQSAVLDPALADLRGPYVLSVAEEDTSAACDDENTGGCVDFDEVEGAVVVAQELSVEKEVRIDFDDLVRNNRGASDAWTPINVADDCLAADGVGFHNQYFARFIIEDDTQADRVIRVSDAVIEVDALAAAQPDSVGTVSATDERIYLEWTQTQSSEVSTYVAFVATQDITGRSLAELRADADVLQKTIALDDLDPDDGLYTGSVKASDLNLRAGEQVWVGISTRDDVENLSEPVFAANPGTVVEVLDFWEIYKDAGGSQAGCASAGRGAPATSLLALCTLLGLLLTRRRLHTS